MTNWIPDLSSSDSGPLYQRLADRIESDIDVGALPAGSKLPPQRDLAFDIGTTVGTVGRAYSLLRERGLVSGEVGRGTYILARQAGAAIAEVYQPSPVEGTRGLGASPGKLRFDSTAAPFVGQSEVLSGMLAAVGRELGTEVASYASDFPDRWFEAGAIWLGRNGFRPAPDSIVPTLGVHAGVMASITAVTAPGDLIAFEHLGSAPIPACNSSGQAAAYPGRCSNPVARPQRLSEHLCAQRHPKAIFLMPAAHNPTAVSMPLERREAVARIAREYNVLLIEDDLYGHMSDYPAPLLAELTPERTITVGGLSKSVAAGMRGGWLTCPPSLRHRIRVAHKLLAGGMPFLLPEVSARLVLSGEAERIRQRSIAEVNARLYLARAALDGYDFNACPNIPFVWLRLPDPWLSGTFKNAAAKAGILIDDEDAFEVRAVGKGLPSRKAGPVETAASGGCRRVGHHSPPA